MRLPELKITVGNEFIEELVKLHGHTLRTLAFIDCGVSMESIATITESCPNMERLELPIPVKDMVHHSIVSRTMEFKTIFSVCFCEIP